MTSPSVRDPGLQPERTAIAWTRTCLALMVVGLIGTRLHSGVAPVVVSLIGFLMAAGLMFASARRARRTEQQLLTERVPPAQGLVLTMTVLVTLLNVASIVMAIVAFHTGYSR